MKPQRSMNELAEICLRPFEPPRLDFQPHAPAIYPASVYRCDSPAAARQALNEGTAFVYQRDGHPNAAMISARLRELHGADWAVVTSAGMSALAAAIFSHVTPQGHIVASNQLYGRTWQLVQREANRLGIDATAVNTSNLDQVQAAIRPETELVIVETISNPLLRVANVQALAKILEPAPAQLLVDNTFATPLGCQPLDLGADLVMESISKIVNGHSDVMLGLLAGRQAAKHADVVDALSVWGLASSPFDCWLAARGLASLPLRFRQAVENASKAAELLENHPHASNVRHPSLASHADAAWSSDVLLSGESARRGGWVVTFDLVSKAEHDSAAAEPFETFAQATQFCFCPSLGEPDTTLSHPASTSHRGLSPANQAALGISLQTVRMSCGTEPFEIIEQRLLAGLAATH